MCLKKCSRNYCGIISRNYENSARQSVVEKHYTLMRKNQTVEFVKRCVSAWMIIAFLFFFFLLFLFTINASSHADLLICFKKRYMTNSMYKEHHSMNHRKMTIKQVQSIPCDAPVWIPQFYAHSMLSNTPFTFLAWLAINEMLAHSRCTPHTTYAGFHGLGILYWRFWSGCGYTKLLACLPGYPDHALTTVPTVLGSDTPRSLHPITAHAHTP